MSCRDILMRIHDMPSVDTNFVAVRWQSRHRKDTCGISVKKKTAA